MAYKDENESTSNNEQPKAQQSQREGRRETPRTEEGTRPVATVLDINRLLGGPMSRRTSGENLVQAIAAVKFHCDEERQINGGSSIDLGKITVLGLDAQEHGGVSVSSVIIAYPVEENGVTRVFTSLLVLESTLEEELRIRNHETNGRSYPLPIVASDYVTEEYLALIDQIVTKHFHATSRRQVEVVRSGWRVVDSGVDFSEPKSTEARMVVFYAMASITAMYNSFFRDDVYFSLDWLSKASSLQISVDMSGRPVYTADGLPRRSDLAISVAGTVPRGDQHIQVSLANLGGYINLIYSPPQYEDRWSRERRQDVPYFTPTFIINRMDTGEAAITPELLLLAMAASSAITKNEAWAQIFLPGDGSSEHRDTGLLNLLGPDKDAGPVIFEGRQGNDFIDRWAQYFFSLVDDRLAWAIELEEGGDNSWITSLLTDAASDDPEVSHDAIRRLYGYADRLTGNNFTRRAKELGVESPLVMSGARYLTGTYLDQSGEKRDLRDWDTLRWLASNPSDEGESALRYQQVIDRTDLDVEIRVSEQYEQLASAMTERNLKFSRYVDLAWINPRFIEALALAVADCKIDIDQRQATYSFGQKRMMGNTRVRDFVGGDLTHNMLSHRRSSSTQRNLRSPVGNGFGRGVFDY